MRWAWRILRVGGIGVYVHVTFLLLPLWIGFESYSQRHLWRDAMMGVAFILVLFAIVVMHELAHALTARRFGIGTRDITLLPIGGVARLERIPEKPRQELLVALAGPAVNICLATLLFGILVANPHLAEAGETAIVGTGFLVGLMWVNVGLALFNLVPAFPMDGGRVLRALLALRLSYARATKLAAGVGHLIALVFGFVGLSSILFGHLGPVSNPFLLFIALFVWVGASREANLVQLRSTLGGVPVSSVMITEFQILSRDQTLEQAVRCLLAGWQHDFPVVENGELLGLLTRRGIIDGLAQRGSKASVEETMTRQFPTLDPASTAEEAFSRLRAGDEQIMLVTKGNALLGIVSRENLHRYLTIRAALRDDGLTESAAGERTQT